jgi:hypothetical protein
MSCLSCGSENQMGVPSEISLHHPGLENVGKPTVMVFSTLLVCMKCGFTGFKMAQTELRLLGKATAEDVDAAG